MKLLVTGATSGLGRNAAEWLLSQGHRVHATGRNPDAGRTLVAMGARFTPLDLTSATAADCGALLEGVDAVWHCAAKSAPWGARATFEAANVSVTARLADAAGRQGVPRFVHISTPAVYFDFRHRYDVDETFRARRFVNHYAASKFTAEQLIASQVEAHPATRYVILRPRALFGPHDRVILPRVIKQIVREHDVLRLPRGGVATLDLTFMLNVVHAMWLATEQAQPQSGAVYNITNHAPARLVDQLDHLLRCELAMDYTVRSVPYPVLHGLATLFEGIAGVTGREPALTRYSVGAVNFDMVLSNRRAIDELGYRPPYSLAEGIEHTARWLRNHGTLETWHN